MTSTATPSLNIPADWSSAAFYFCDLQHRAPFSLAEWAALKAWLLTTEFSQEGWLAGECALALFRDHASPELRLELVRSLEQTNLLPRLKALLPEVLQGPRSAGRFAEHDSVSSTSDSQ